MSQEPPMFWSAVLRYLWSARYRFSTPATCALCRNSLPNQQPCSKYLGLLGYYLFVSLKTFQILNEPYEKYRLN